jgi:hypothetical protein
MQRRSDPLNLICVNSGVAVLDVEYDVPTFQSGRLGEAGLRHHAMGADHGDAPAG